MKIRYQTWLAILLGVAASVSSRAGNVVWINTNGGNWSATANWNPHRVPGSADTAIITNKGNYTVTLNVSANTGGLILGATNGTIQTFLFNGQTFALNGTATIKSGGQFNLSSGTFNGVTNGAGAVVSGNLNCSGGRLSGKLTLMSDGVVNLSGNAASNTFSSLVIFTNRGKVNWSDTDLYGQSSLQIYNYGLWDAQSDNTFYGGGTVFNNFGTFRKSGGGTTTLDSNMTFNSTNTVDVESGTLAIQSGTCSGILNTASGTILNLGYNPNLITFILTGNCTFTGQGIIEGIEIGSDNALIGGTVTFSAATLYNTMTVSNTSVVNFVGTLGSNSFANGTFNNYGTVNWSNTDLHIGAGFATAQINNYGLWDAKTNNTLGGTDSAHNFFYNYGTFRKSSGGGITMLNSKLTFRNTGTVDVESGALAIQNGYAISNGTFNIAVNAEVNFSGVSGFLSYGGTSFTGSGSILGNLNGSSGGSNVINGTITYLGGTLSGSLIVASNAVLNLPVGANFSIPSYANLANYGTVNWISGDLGSGGGKIDNYGLWDAKSNNTFYGGNSVNKTIFNNYGTFRKPGGNFPSGQTILDNNTSFNNSGTVDIQTGVIILGHAFDSGAVNVASNTAFYSSPCTLAGSPTFSGSGFVQGDLYGSNAVLNGSVTLNYATLSGSLTIASNAVVNLSTAFIDLPVNFNAVVLTNFGTVNWVSGNLSGTNAQLFNYGLWDAKTNGTMSGVVFNNYGNFRKSGGNFPPGLTMLDNNTSFNNSGTVDIQTGLIILGHAFDSGAVNVASNAAFYSSACTLAGSPTFSGSGFVQGGLYGSNAVLNGSVTLNYATLSGSLTIASNAVVNLTDFVDLPVNFNAVVLTNFGTVNWVSGNLSGTNAQLFNYGLWDANANNTFSGGSATVFNNYGTFRKSGGPFDNGEPYDTRFDDHTVFNNYGTLEVQIGILLLLGGGTGNGIFNNATNQGAYLGTYVLTGNPTFTGGGSVSGSLTGSNAVVHGTLLMGFYTTLSGTLTIASNAVLNLGRFPGQTILFQGTILTNYGTAIWNYIDLACQSSPQIYNYGLWDAKTNNTFYGASDGQGITTFNNYGTFRKSGGTVNDYPYETLLDNHTTLNNPGIVDVQIGQLEIGGSYSLAGGTLNFGIGSANDFGAINFGSTNAVLAGTLSVNLKNGYSPGSGSSFPVVRYGYDSESGLFTALNLPPLAPGLMWQTNYGAAAFTVIVTNPPPLQLSSVAIQNGTNFSFTWTAVPNQTYQVQCTTNLAPADWLDLGSPITATNATLTFSDVIGMKPQRFYRVMVQ